MTHTVQITEKFSQHPSWKLPVQKYSLSTHSENYREILSTPTVKSTQNLVDTHHANYREILSSSSPSWTGVVGCAASSVFGDQGTCVPYGVTPSPETGQNS